MRTLVILLVLAGCSSEPGAPRIVAATPDHGPLVGGTTIVLSGSGLDRATAVRVLIGGRQAPLARVLDDSSLEVVIPPGDRPGAAELLLISDTVTTTAPQVFHYSAPPAIETVSPPDVVYDSTTTTVTVTGHGFLEEAAGELHVLVDGKLAADAVVESDTKLTFIAPPGIAFVSPDLEIRDLRGSATKPRSFRYRPGASGGLLLFTRYGSAFATFFDPVSRTSFPIPRTGPAWGSFTTVVLDARGDYWAFDRNLAWGRIDMRTQTLAAPIQTQLLIPAMVRMGSTYYAIERYTAKFGRFEPTTATFVPIAPVPCCGSFGLATDGTTIWFTARVVGTATLNTIVPSTGELGTPVPLPPGSHIEELRWLDGVLYGTNANQTLAAIDPATGALTVMPVSPGRVNAMEIVE